MQPLSIIDRGRGPELVGTRITVFDIIPYLQEGDSATYIAAVLGLSTRQVEALIEYIEAHRDEVMAANQKIEERIARGNPPEVLEKLASSPIHALIQSKLKERQRPRTPEANGEGNSRGQ